MTDVVQPLSVDIPTIAGAGAAVASAIVAALTLRREVIRDRVRQAFGGRPGHGAPPERLDDIAAGTAPTPIVSPTGASRLSRVQRDKLLRCGCIKHPPLADFTYVGDHAEFKGLYPAMAYAVATAATLTPLIVPIDWADLHGVFEAKGLDVVLSVFETRDRCTYADFVCPFYSIGLSGVIRDAETRSFDDATALSDPDVKVVVTRGEAGWETAALDLRIPRHRLTILENADLDQMMDLVRSGAVDIAICDDVSCDRAVHSRPGLRHVFATRSLDICKNAIMVPKGDPEFNEWVDDQFTRIRHQPAIQALETEVLDSYGTFIRRFR